MKDFLGIVRDTLPIDNPVGTWQYGRNMVVNKKTKTASNEDGFSFEYLISGTIIGTIVTNSDIVYFSKNDDGTDEIGVVRTEVDNPIYETKIKSSLFNFQLNCPIEGVFIYNYKEELIVAWCDGVKNNSNKPYVANLDNLSVELNIDKTLVDDNEFTKLYMFPNKQEADIILTYTATSVFTYPVLYITYKYVDNDTDLPYFDSHTIAYVHTLDEEYNTKKRGINLKLFNLDENFNKIKLGIIGKDSTGTLFGFESTIIDYTKSNNPLIEDKEIILTSLSNFIAVDSSSIVINPTSLERIETLAVHDNQIQAGKIKYPEDILFQKYANLLEVEPFSYIDNEDIYNSLLPDEVYALYIELQKKDGTYTKAFHIPGRKAEDSETDSLTASQITDYNLGWVDNDYKQFHIFNTGSLREGYLDVNDNLQLRPNKFGYWENVDTYPNNTNYDSSLLGGEDLRNTPIRHHRVPPLLSTIGGVLNKDNFSSINNYGDPSIQNYKIGVTIKNFNTIIDSIPEIKNQIQGYKISFAKRDSTNNLIFSNSLLLRRLKVEGFDSTQKFEGVHGIDTTDVTLQESLPGSSITRYISEFNKLRAYNTEIFKFKNNNTPTFSKINYVAGFQENSSDNEQYSKPIWLIADKYKYAEINNIEYKIGNNYAANTPFTEEALNIDFNNFDFKNGLTVFDNFSNASDFTQTELNEIIFSKQFAFNATLFYLKQNVYSSFTNQELITLSKTTFINNTNLQLRGGDAFLSNLDVQLYTVVKSTKDTGTSREEIESRHLQFTFKNLFSSVRGTLFSDSTANGFIDQNEPNDLELPSDTYLAELNLRQYTFDIKEAYNSAIQNITTSTIFNINIEEVNLLPFRIHRGLKVGSESLSTNFRIFLANAYYDMPNNKGEIIALRVSDRKLFIQMKYSLFVASIKEVLQTKNADAYLSQGDLFDYKPKEIGADTKGFIGSVSKFACTVFQEQYVTINGLTGQIFIIGQNVKEISKQGNQQWFRNNWITNKNIDNPYISYGFLIGYDKEYSRLLFIKKDYEFIGDINEVTTDGEFYTLISTGEKIEFNDTNYFKNNSKTLSFNLDLTTWQFEHDYYPNLIFNTHANLYSIINTLNGVNKASIYKHNNKAVKGLYYGNKFESSVDLIFNGRIELTKLYQSIHWVTSVINQNKGTEQFKTISKIMVYNDSQCSGIINIDTSAGGNIKTRNNEWYFNDFRDLMSNQNLPIIDENGELVSSSLDNSKVWFEKSNFISKFIVVRLIIDNVDNDDVFIHQVNVKSIISK